MKAISLIDLDDSVFQSRKKCPSNAELTPAAVDRKGNWHSFLTPQQLAFVQLLDAGGTVIPVTARETDGFRRVRMRFSSFAVTSFGAVILTPAGEIEPHWHSYIQEQSAKVADDLAGCHHILAQMAEIENIDARIYKIVDAGLSLYVNAKHNGHNVEELRLLAMMFSAALPSGWKMHFNGNNLAILPPYIGKEYAVEYYLKNLAPSHSFVLGLGDSFTDLGFMGLCDYAITPTRGQVFDHLKSIDIAARLAAPLAVKQTSKGETNEHHPLVA